MAAFLLELAAKAQAMSDQRPVWERSEQAYFEVPDRALDLPVLGICIHAARTSATPRNNAEAPTDAAHFRLYLAVGPDSSVELDSSGAAAGGVTKLRIVYRTYLYSDTRTKLKLATITPSGPGAFTIRQVLREFFDNGREKYKLDPNTGSGCRYWCTVVIGDFIDNGWVDKEHKRLVDEVASAAKKAYPELCMPEPAPRGIFYE